MPPIALADVQRARELLNAYLVPTPLRHYPLLDQEVGGGIRVLVKHENFQPTGSFKIRNGIAAVAALSQEQRARGIIAATRGNHGQGLAYAGRLLGVEVTICVPHGNSVEKNAAMRALGAQLIEHGVDYDDAVAHALVLMRERELTMVHSSDDPYILAGAGTLSLEVHEQASAFGRLDAVLVSLGGGSQAVGAITVFRELAPNVKVYAVQAAHAPAQHDSFRAGEIMTRAVLPTIADGLATRSAYELTFPVLKQGLADVVTVSEGEIAEALRMVMRTTHTMVEGAAAAAFAGLTKLRAELAGMTVATVISGANIDQPLLARVLRGEI